MYKVREEDFPQIYEIPYILKFHRILCKACPSARQKSIHNVEVDMFVKFYTKKEIVKI